MDSPKGVGGPVKMQMKMWVRSFALPGLGWCSFAEWSGK